MCGRKPATPAADDSRSPPPRAPQRGATTVHTADGERPATRSRKATLGGERAAGSAALLPQLAERALHADHVAPRHREADHERRDEGVPTGTMHHDAADQRRERQPEHHGDPDRSTRVGRSRAAAAPHQRPRSALRSHRSGVPSRHRRPTGGEHDERQQSQRTEHEAALRERRLASVRRSASGSSVGWWSKSRARVGHCAAGTRVNHPRPTAPSV